MLALRLTKAYLEEPLKHPLPLLVDLRNADREFSLEGLLSTHFQQRGLPRMTFALFEHALATGRLVLLLDGFDEMATRVTPQVTTRNFHELAKSVRSRAKVLLTCRTHYFLDRRNEQEVMHGAARGYDSDAANKLYWDLISRRGFRVAYLCPFETSQIEEYVRHARPRDANAALARIRKIYDLIELSRRPMLLDMIIRSLDRLEGDSISAAELYRVFTNVWIQRDRWRDGPLSPDSKHHLVTSLACRLWTSGAEHMHHRQLTSYFADAIGGSADVRTMLEVDSEMRTASFLVRTPDFSNANLSGARLDNAVCINANFTGADLSEASVAGTDMTGTDLTNAILANALLADKQNSNDEIGIHSGTRDPIDTALRTWRPFVMQLIIRHLGSASRGDFGRHRTRGAHSLEHAT